ncbi:hypothetical protein [Cysteiniphilum sp. 6C5]|uniref:hypothetical protein n=1 Tax=unclassified Cysteiniphilum TaxID=2610889 RepID=UPI003F850939
MKKICIVLFALGVMPLGNAIALESKAVGDEIRQLHLDDSALNTLEGLNKIKNNQYLQNLLYSRVSKMDKGDQYNWYQHSEFGKFILSNAGQYWIETHAGDEWLKQAQWLHWLQENAKNTWVFNNAAISWLNSPAALRWVDKHFGKNQFSKLMAYCADIQSAQYKSDCEILKNTKAGKAFYDHSESRSSDHLFTSNALQNSSMQDSGQTDSGFDNKGFDDGKPSFGELDRNTSPYKADILNASNVSITGGAVAASAAIPAAVVWGRLQDNSQTEQSEQDANTLAAVNKLKKCQRSADTVECSLTERADVRTLINDIERSWDIRINNQSLTVLFNNQLLEGVGREYDLGSAMSPVHMSNVLTLMYSQAIERANLAGQSTVNIPGPIDNDVNNSEINDFLRELGDAANEIGDDIVIGNNIIRISHADMNDSAGSVSVAGAINNIVNVAHGLEADQTRLFPILRDGHFYLIAIHRTENGDYQVLVFDSAGINTQNSSLARGVIEQLQQQTHERVTPLVYSRGIQAGNDCGFYVTYLMHRLINRGFSRVVHDLGLVNGAQDSLFELNPQSVQQRNRVSIWLRNYFTQLYQLVENYNRDQPQDEVGISFLNDIQRTIGFNGLTSLILLAYQTNNSPYINDAHSDDVLSEVVLQSIENHLSRKLSEHERRLILESHQGAVAPLTNTFIESAFARGIEIGLDSTNKKEVVNVVLDEDAPNNSHIKLGLTVPIIAAETGSAVGDLVASTNISLEQKAKKMTKGKHQRKSKNQGYQIPVRQSLVYKDISMRFEAKPDSRRV